jgi:hypothetical protein
MALLLSAACVGLAAGFSTHVGSARMSAPSIAPPPYSESSHAQLPPRHGMISRARVAPAVMAAAGTVRFNEWNAFRASKKGQGLSMEEVAKMYREHKLAKAKVNQAEATQAAAEAAVLERKMSDDETSKRAWLAKLDLEEVEWEDLNKLSYALKNSTAKATAPAVAPVPPARPTYPPIDEETSRVSRGIANNFWDLSAKDFKNRWSGAGATSPSVVAAYPPIEDETCRVSPGIANNFWDLSAKDFKNRWSGAGASTPSIMAAYSAIEDETRRVSPGVANNFWDMSTTDFKKRFFGAGVASSAVEIDEERNFISPGIANNFWDMSSRDFKETRRVSPGMANNFLILSTDDFKQTFPAREAASEEADVPEVPVDETAATARPKVNEEEAKRAWLVEEEKPSWVMMQATPSVNVPPTVSEDEAKRAWLSRLEDPLQETSDAAPEATPEAAATPVDENISV